MKKRKADPNNPDLHNNRGVALWFVLRNEDAINEFDRALAIEPKRPDYNFNKGNALSSMDRKDEAIVVYDKAISLSPNTSHIHNNKGVVLWLSGREDEALLEFTKAIESGQSERGYYTNKIIALEDAAKLSEVLETIEGALRIDPIDPDLLIKYLGVMGSQGRGDDGIARVVRAIRDGADRRVLCQFAHFWYTVTSHRTEEEKAVLRRFVTEQCGGERQRKVPLFAGGRDLYRSPCKWSDDGTRKTKELQETISPWLE
ncbi:MAG: tetratricopeptide repeat protein [archaeon]|nr:MAG: tetratricopeptide repeat protein [archaeon]